jgi:hypothetical protein
VVVSRARPIQSSIANRSVRITSNRMVLVPADALDSPSCRSNIRGRLDRWNPAATVFAARRGRQSAPALRHSGHGVASRRDFGWSIPITLYSRAEAAALAYAE